MRKLRENKLAIDDHNVRWDKTERAFIKKLERAALDAGPKKRRVEEYLEFFFEIGADRIATSEPDRIVEKFSL
jgi:hypothetical protein